MAALSSSVEHHPFGCLPDGRLVTAIRLANERGMRATVISYGATLQSLWLPDASGTVANVALGFTELSSYIEHGQYFGGTIGRFANRIAEAAFAIDGTRYQVTPNVAPHSLHGGANGFDKQLWDWHVVEDAETIGVRLRYTSPDGEEGYPGTLSTEVAYVLKRYENTLRLEFVARTDRPTVVNLTNHTYFNLAGEGSGTALEHELQIDASYYLPLRADLIPSGALEPVAEGPMDFRSPTRIDQRIRVATKQLLLAQGYDHNYVLDRRGTGLSRAARVVEPSTGRAMELWTTEPGLDFYSGNFLDGTVAGFSGHAYRQGDGFALEPERFSDSPNNPHFPSTLLRPGDEFRSASEYRFEVLSRAMCAGPLLQEAQD